MRMLLVDDDPEIRHLARIALERAGGHEVECAGTGEEALAAAAARRPDAVLLDVLLPDADGVDLLARLRGIEGMEEVPVVFLTGKSAAADRDRIASTDARGVVAKPFDPLSLAGEIDRLVGATPGRGEP